MTSITDDFGLYICLYQMRKIVVIGLLCLVLIGSVLAWLGYAYVVKDNVVDIPEANHDLYIGAGWTYDSLLNGLDAILISKTSFDRVAKEMNLPNKIRPGKYEIVCDLGNRDLINMLRSGQTKDVKVILTGSIARNQIFSKIAEPLEIDSLDLMNMFKNDSLVESLGYNTESWPCLFIANTYFFNWATAADQVVQRFVTEHLAFWDDERSTKAQEIDLTPNEVVILASIVDSETMMDTEMPMIAGVYLNRLQQNWPLGADPTIRYLINEEGRQRVLYKDLEVESPYNTYKNLGLPPGPILLPSTKAIDAVLNAANTEFMFFCAKADFSGYHSFAKTNAQHERNRSAYRRALNQRGIMR